jgi:hypothetical protein
MGDRYRIVPPITVKRTWPMYRQRERAQVRAFQVDRPFDVELLEGRLQGGVGDYLCIGPGGRAWVMDEETFNAVFTRGGDEQ